MYRLGTWKYVNHLGEEFSSDKVRVFIEDNQLMDFKRPYTSTRGRVTSFSKDVAEKVIPIVIHGDDEEDGINLRNELYSITTKDVLAKQPGRFYVGEWYLSGYIVESAKTSFMITDRLMRNSLTFVSELGTWRKDLALNLYPQKQETKSHQYIPPTVTGHEGSKPVQLPKGVLYKDFEYDYFLPDTRHAIYPMYDFKYDYYRKIGSSSMLVSDAVSDSPFTMTIYGPCDHPIVIINGHQYGVNALVYDGERIVIDSEARTVIKIGRLGETTNLFNSRDKASSIFAPIPPGSSTVLWPGTYGVDLVVHEERMEPVWTLSS